MKEGDILQIKGPLGFLMNPQVEVLKIDGGVVTITTHPRKEGGILSFTNETMIGRDLLESKI